MLRHRRIGVFTALALALVMLLSAASVSLAQSIEPDSKTGGVEVTGIVPADLTVGFPVLIDFGIIPNDPEYARVTVPMVFTVESNLPYKSWMVTDDIGTLPLNVNNVSVAFQNGPTSWQALADDGYQYPAGIDGGPTFGTTFNRTSFLSSGPHTVPLAPAKLHLVITITVTQFI